MIWKANPIHMIIQWWFSPIFLKFASGHLWEALDNEHQAEIVLHFLPITSQIWLNPRICWKMTVFTDLSYLNPLPACYYLRCRLWIFSWNCVALFRSLSWIRPNRKIWCKMTIFADFFLKFASGRLFEMLKTNIKLKLLLRSLFLAILFSQIQRFHDKFTIFTYLIMILVGYFKHTLRILKSKSVPEPNGL